jgi:hypothetical protein
MLTTLIDRAEAEFARDLARADHNLNITGDHAAFCAALAAAQTKLQHACAVARIRYMLADYLAVPESGAWRSISYRNITDERVFWVDVTPDELEALATLPPGGNLYDAQTRTMHMTARVALLDISPNRDSVLLSLETKEWVDHDPESI